MSFEQLFGSSVLNVVVADTSVEYPPQKFSEEWLTRLSSNSVQRKQAFFDEDLRSLVTFRIEHPIPAEPVDSEHPPYILLAFLAHIQISLEATYISPTPASNPGAISRISAPPRTAPLLKGNSHLKVHHPSIFPPSTPNPTPSSTDQDKRYLASEGTLLLASIWGQDTSEDSREAFSLFWSEKEQVWVAIYQLSTTISFLRLNFADPLLCLTVSATLRDKPLALTQPKHPLSLFLLSIGSQLLATPESPTSPNGPSEEVQDDGYDRLEEVNLLEGLLASTTFSTGSEDKRLYLPSTRLGTVSRQKLFSLPPISLPPLITPSPSPMTAVRTAHPTLRKSYRKTLQTVSGFRVRMRTVFVPYVLLPDFDNPNTNDKNLKDATDEDIETQVERERREAGNDERTVVLCVEVENSGESGSGVGFMVEKVDVNIGGEGAKITLIRWGRNASFDKDKDGNGDEGEEQRPAFPLRVGPMAQFNLLYAVSFLRAPEEVEGFSLVPRDSSFVTGSELQRAVTISIFGKPYLFSKSSPLPEEEEKNITYPTRTFSSKWNCVLDLSHRHSHNGPNHDDDDDEGGGGGRLTSAHQALPEPPSPFPVPQTPRTSGFGFLLPTGAYSPGSPGSTPQSSITVGSKRHTLPSAGVGVGTGATAGRSVRGAASPLRATHVFNAYNQNQLHKDRDRDRERDSREREKDLEHPSSTSGPSPRLSYLPPSVSTQPPRSPTTYNTTPPPPPPHSPHPPSPQPPQLSHIHTATAHGDLSSHSSVQQPMTPAYPPHSAVPPTPMSQGPIASHSVGVVGPSVEIRRERGAGGAVGVGVPVPQTPGPWIGAGAGGGFGFGGVGEHGHGQGQGYAGVKNGEAIVVSVGLLPLPWKKGKDEGRIYPLDCFTLDIFVFNQSEWTRRFEISCVDRRRRKGGGVGVGEKDKGKGGKGKDGRSKSGVMGKMGYPGVLPLDSRVRIGPLRPSACQSVRMEFLAITPGVHSIDALMLTDVESGFSMNLRSVMDVVVHEPR